MSQKSSLLNEFRENILGPQEIIGKAVEHKIDNGISTKDIKKNFSALIQEIEKDAYSTYLLSEEQAWKKSVNGYFKENLGKKPSFDKTLRFVQGRFGEFNSFFLSLSQSRRSRAGSAFEYIIKMLFKRLEYPFDEQQIINGKPDFLMPSRAHYDQNPLDCIIFTAKRTLRERWRQIVTEGAKGRGFFLATIDEKVSRNGLEQMKNNKIYLVVPKHVKKKVEHYRTAHNVISFEDFFEDYLDPAMKRWKKAGVLKRR